MKKVILHLCADIGSDSRFYQLSDEYEVILIGKVYKSLGDLSAEKLKQLADSGQKLLSK